MKRILIQLDTDPQPSTFDRIVAIDAGVDEVFAHGSITPGNLAGLVHGAMFTRAPDELCNTAIFVGGSDVAAGEEVFEKVTDTFFGPMRVSVMVDSNGSNTTAAAAVQAAARHIDLRGASSLILGGTGPVGHRAGQILASRGGNVQIASRSRSRAEKTCRDIQIAVEGANVKPVELADRRRGDLLEGIDLLIAAGAAGVRFLAAEEWQGHESLKVAIDLNAVPPVGLEGIEVTDKGRICGNIVCYGAIGVGGTKMKLHKAAVRTLYESNSAQLNTSAIAEIAEQLD